MAIVQTMPPCCAGSSSAPTTGYLLSRPGPFWRPTRGRVSSELAGSLAASRPSGDQTRFIAMLRNVLRLEQKRKYDDRAVVGGLAEFIGARASELVLPPDLARRLEGYPAAEADTRKSIVSDLL